MTPTSKRPRARRVGEPSTLSPVRESILATVDAILTATEEADAAERAGLTQDIEGTVDRLKRRVERQLGRPVNVGDQYRLPMRESQQESDPAHSARRLSVPRFPEPVLRVFAKDFAGHALRHLPHAARYHSTDEFRTYLANTLRFNAHATRVRFAEYIVNRFFPGKVFNEDLPLFAAATEGQRALGEGLFYLTCRTEKLLALVAEEVVFPSLAQGGVSRARLGEYMHAKFPRSKSVDEMIGSIVRTYQLYGIGTAERARLGVSVREGTPSAFAYVLHHEFPEPGMHAFDNMLGGPMHKWLLWDKQWMVRQLYRLREVGLLSKVSEIDRLRHFTTKYTLTDALERIVMLAQESPQ